MEPHELLSERQREILTAIIEDFIKNAEPVGSRSLTRRKNIDLSPATVRNAMADLEELGFLSAPHASAGRIPTPGRSGSTWSAWPSGAGSPGGSGS